MMTTLIFLGVLGVGYFIFMKFYLPKYMAKANEAQKEADEIWNTKKDEIFKEYFTNSDKFGLISDVIKDEKIIGLASGTIINEKSLKDKALSGLKDAVTMTKEVDMSLSYFVATDKGLHFTSFDGQKCFNHEVFDYEHINNAKLDKDNKLTFDYKEEKLKYFINKTIQGYPRFEIHEGHNKKGNYFVRQYFAYEETENIRYKQVNDLMASNMSAMNVTPEKINDAKLKAELMKGLTDKLNIA